MVITYITNATPYMGMFFKEIGFNGWMDIYQFSKDNSIHKPVMFDYWINRVNHITTQHCTG